MEKFVDEEGIDPSSVYRCKRGACIEIPQTARAVFLSGCAIQSMKLIEIGDGVRGVAVDRNAIETIEWTGFEKGLLFLDVSANLISKIQNFERMERLRTLRASGNRISVLENLEQCLSLRSLVLSRNRVHSVFLTRPLFSLCELDLSFNPIYEFPFASVFPNLLVLRLNNCFISGVGWAREFRRLKELYLAGNKICDDEVMDVPSLEVLDISDNCVRSLFMLDGLHSLRVLRVDGNPLGDEGVEVDFTLGCLRSIDVSRTLLTRVTPLLKLSQRLEHVEMTGVDASDLIEFISRTPNLTELDLRGTEATQGLYFDKNYYGALSEYDRVFPANAEKRREYRQRILKMNPRLVRLDGILTEEERTAKYDNMRERLAQLIDEQNRIRKLLGLELREELPKELGDLRSWVSKIQKENVKLQKKLEGRQRFEQELEPLLKENIRLRKALHIEGIDEFTASDIDVMITHFVEANEALRLELEAKRSNTKSRQYVYERCTKLLMAMAREPCTARRVENGSTEFHVLQAFIASKMTVKIKLVSALRNNVHTRFIEMEAKLKWLSLVVDDGSNSINNFDHGIHSPIVVADHMNHIVHRLTKRRTATFTICAFDNGKTVVDRNTNGLPDISDRQCDTVLFHMRNSQFFYALNPERIIPLFLVEVTLREEDPVK